MTPETNRMNFGQAIEALKQGKKVAREVWSSKHLGILHPGKHSASIHPYICMFSPDGDRVPWLTYCFDVLAEDWVIIE